MGTEKNIQASNGIELDFCETHSIILLSIKPQLLKAGQFRGPINVFEGLQ